MQVSNNNNTSFGINLVRFENKEAKDFFNSKNTLIGKNAMARMWNEIKDLKPKKGPDIDVYIGRSTDDKFSTLTCKQTVGDKVFQKAFAKIDGENEHTSNGIIKAFKDVIYQINKDRA
jgi:hypothetical protein